MNSRESSKRGRKHSCRLISHSKTTLLTLSFMLTFSLPSLLELFKLLDIKSRSHCVIFLFLTDVFPPTILSFSNKTVYKKTTVKLRCSISAYPAPTVQWFKDGTSLGDLSPTIYWYLATGDLQVALQRASCADVNNHDLVDYITRVCV